MKIDINKIPAEGLSLEEEIVPSTLDLETEIIKFSKPIKARADISKITNTIMVDMVLGVSVCASCSRCLNEFETTWQKNLKLTYLADRLKPEIDLNPDIREEIILDYPLKPLCRLDCKGLCPKCGKNLNEGGCSCGST